mmetsp:Transcript_21193/g.33296  ORF Transcript_21193/g.33296 Transcript_21193/m.33296 type:complete len:669 (-) Transcript_21193:52-2058(-)
MSQVVKPVDITVIENTSSNEEEQKKMMMKQNNNKQLFESTTTSGMGGGSSNNDDTTTTDNSTKRNIDAFYQVLWPVLEKEGGWTLVKGTGSHEGLTIFCPPGTTATNTDIVQLSNRILAREGEQSNDDNNNDGDTTDKQITSTKLSSVLELVNQQGPWREASSTTPATNNATTNTTTTNTNTTTKKPQYYTKMRQVIEQILKKETAVETKAAEAYEAVILNAVELFGESTTNNTDDTNNEKEEEGSIEGNANPTNNNNNNEVPMSPTTRMTRQRFSDIAWKENRTHYEKSSSRVGLQYQVDVLPVVGSHTVPEEEVLYDQVWDPEKAQKSGKIDFIDHRVKSSIKEPAYNMLHQRDYQLPGFFAEVSKAPPTDCSHWTSEERAKFRKLVFEKHEDMWQISEALGRPVRECVTYYLGKFKTSKDFRSLRRVMEKARDENPFKYPGEILCDKCGKGGKLVYCDSCDSHYHLTCQDPPLSEVPEGNDWKCNKCVEKDKNKEKEEKEVVVEGGETDDKTEDTSKTGGGEVAEMDTSNADQEEVSSFEGKGSETNHDAGLTSTTNKQDEPENGNSVEEKKEVVASDANAANDEISDSSANTGGEKRPSSRENDDNNNNSDTPQHQAKKAKSLTNVEQDTSGTSSLVETAPQQPQQQQPNQQQQEHGDANENSS